MAMSVNVHEHFSSYKKGIFVDSRIGTLGHALGSSGSRLLGTLLNYLETTGGRYGLQTMCEGGGMANAMIIERL